MAGTPEAFSASAFDNTGFQTGGSTPPTPTPLVPGAGKGAKRHYVVRSDGRRQDVYDTDDLRRIIDDIARERTPKQKKISKKVKRAAKPIVNTGALLQEFASWDTLEAELAQLNAVIEERLLIDLVLAILVREGIRQDDEEVMLLLEMMT